MARSSRYMVAGVLIVLLGALVAGCGGGSSSSSSETTAESNTTSNSAEETTSEGPEGSSGNLAEAEKKVAEAEDLEGIKWPEPPDEPYDPGTGKAAIIVCGTAGEGCLEQGELDKEALEAAGWDPGEILDGQFTASVQNGLIQKAVQEHVDGIVLNSIELASVKAGVEAAEKAGIPIACEFCAETPGYPVEGGPVPVSIDSGVGSGELIGEYIAVQAKGKGKVTQIVDPNYPVILERVAGTKKAIETYCPECEYEAVNLSDNELTEPGPPYFTALLAAHPPGDLEWIAATADTYANPIVKTAEQSGRSELKFTSIGAETAAFPQKIQEGLGEAAVYTPDAYVSWAAVDQVLRQSAGLEPWATGHMPDGLVTKKNVAQVLKNAPAPYYPPAFNFKAMFKKLWSGK